MRDTKPPTGASIGLGTVQHLHGGQRSPLPQNTKSPPGLGLLGSPQHTESATNRHSAQQPLQKHPQGHTHRSLGTEGHASGASSSELLRKAGPLLGSWTQEDRGHRRNPPAQFQTLDTNILCRGHGEGPAHRCKLTEASVRD